MNDFVQKMNDHQRNISELLNVYIAFTPTTEPDEASVAAVNERLRVLISLYTEARAAYDLARTAAPQWENAYTDDYARKRYIQKRVSKLKVATPAEIIAEEIEAANAWEQERRAILLKKAAEDQYKTAKSELLRVLPAYVWVKLDSQLIGISSSEWNGTHYAVHIKNEGDKLPPLEHTTYYD